VQPWHWRAFGSPYAVAATKVSRTADHWRLCLCYYALCGRSNDHNRQYQCWTYERLQHSVFKIGDGWFFRCRSISRLRDGCISKRSRSVIVQGAIALFSAQLSFLQLPMYVNDFSAVGNLLIAMIGLRMLGIKEIKVGNYLRLYLSRFSWLGWLVLWYNSLSAMSSKKPKKQQQQSKKNKSKQQKDCNYGHALPS